MANLIAVVAGTWRLTVEGVYKIAGHGTVVAGKMVAEGEPALGAVTVFLPDCRIARRQVRAFEKFAIPNWWCHNVGVLLDVGDDVPVGSVIEGEVRSR